ncbi:MAG: NAD(P)/FAD-dependent oxidoreductase [Deltaproteobacteria bacterium]|nr:NAD(P)/FAD-dependent oxidoreductase [Deltaproteobacteria bacterium]
MLNKEVKRPHVVIIGAGFGGLNAVKVFKREPVSITLIDKTNHHLFQPLLYQVATSGLTPADIATPIRFVLRHQQNVNVLLGEVLQINASRKCVALFDQEITYDYLIVAAGATHTYFGNDHWASIAPGLKTIAEAVEIRRRILTAFETAEKCAGDHNREDITTLVVIGGGATGVEIAGAVAELTRISMASDFRKIDPRKTRILLIEAGPRLLPNMSEHSSKNALESLRKLGVEVLLNSPVTDLADHYLIAGGHRISTRTVIWSAGVVGSPLAKTLEAPLDNHGKVQVNEDLSIPAYPEIFVVGDLASFRQSSGDPVPGLAPAAIQEGRHAARNILRLINGKSTIPFRYFDKGTLATIGRSKAVADIGSLKLSNFFAWVIWLFTHIFFLIGFRNRFIVLIQWAWAYITYHTYSRLITYPWKPWVPGLPDRQVPDYPGCPCERITSLGKPLRR